MRIKKKELRRGLAQLPINYPAPAVANGFQYEAEKCRVENLCKRLAHNEVEIRDAVLLELPRYLREVTSGQHPPPSATATATGDLELLLMKLCRGVFFCLWHSDKPLVQLECAQRIAELLWAPATAETRALWVVCLFRTVSREWKAIDRFRLDKYLALVRKLLFQTIVWLKEMDDQGRVAGPPPPTETVHHSARARSRGGGGGAESEPRGGAADVYRDLIAALQEVLLDPLSVGLTMHLCDVVFDELCRAEVPRALFVRLAADLPLFVMSRGNYVEKRILDFFIAPIVGGVLRERWLAAAAKAAGRRGGAAAEGPSGADAAARVEAEVALLVGAVADLCQQFAVQRGTARAVRVMFSEAEFLLRQALGEAEQPAGYARVTGRAMRTRLAREVEEANDSRIDSILARRERRRERTRRSAAPADVAATRDAERQRKIKRTNTKRKRDYHLTKKDLCSDED